MGALGQYRDYLNATINYNGLEECGIYSIRPALKNKKHYYYNGSWTRPGHEGQKW